MRSRPLLVLLAVSAAAQSLIRETHLDDQMKKFSLWRGWAAGKRGRQR
jgi:hypothetical protein